MARGTVGSGGNSHRPAVPTLSVGDAAAFEPPIEAEMTPGTWVSAERFQRHEAVRAATGAPMPAAQVVCPSGRTLRLGANAAAVLWALDRPLSAAECAALVGANQVEDVERVRTILVDLHQAGLLAGSPPPDTRRGERRFSIPLPYRLLARLAPRSGLVARWARSFTIALAVTAVAAASYFLAAFMVQPSLPEMPAVASGLVLVVLGCLIHELGHAYEQVRWGGRADRIGVKLRGRHLSLYCTLTDQAPMSDRSRVRVFLSGPLLQAAFAGLLAGVSLTIGLPGARWSVVLLVGLAMQSLIPTGGSDGMRIGLLYARPDARLRNVWAVRRAFALLECLRTVVPPVITLWFVLIVGPALLALGATGLLVWPLLGATLAVAVARHRARTRASGPIPPRDGELRAAWAVTGALLIAVLTAGPTLPTPVVERVALKCNVQEDSGDVRFVPQHRDWLPWFGSRLEGQIRRGADGVELSTSSDCRDGTQYVVVFGEPTRPFRWLGEYLRV